MTLEFDQKKYGRPVCMFEDARRGPIPNPAEQPDTQGFQFGRMFPSLNSFAHGQDQDAVIQRLRELGKRGGLMDATDPLITITNPLESNPTKNPDNTNPDMTVGFTFLGQFLDHDITLDNQPLDYVSTSELNERSPFFDLDSVYGQGPAGSPLLYDPFRKGRLKIDLEFPRDLSRNEYNQPFIPDGRNDENTIISQMQLAFIKFHNQVLNLVEKEKGLDDPHQNFLDAQKLVRWHYQYIIVNQFLPATLDPDVYESIKTVGPTLFTVTAMPEISREFQIAAYRFGHSQIRPGYKINVTFGAPIFDATLDSLDDRNPFTTQDADPNDLRGDRRAARRFVEWDTFFDFGTKEVAEQNGGLFIRPKVKKNKRIDPFISSPMLELPVGPGLPTPGDEIRSLAGRNLERHYQHKIPSGQEIAGALGYPALTARETEELAPLGFQDSTPLWWYILKEAFVQHSGERLGKVGSRIIAETFFGLLLSDPNSYWTVDRAWVPTLPRRSGATTGNFTMTDLLSFARIA